jgi:hypothetical protein
LVPGRGVAGVAPRPHFSGVQFHWHGGNAFRREGVRMSSSGGIRLYKKSDALKALPTLRRLFLEQAYPLLGERREKWVNHVDLGTGPLVPVLVHWTHDLGIKFRKDITLEMIVAAYQPWMSIWTQAEYPFLKEDMLRISYGTNLFPELEKTLGAMDDVMDRMLREKT